MSDFRLSFNVRTRALTIDRKFFHRSGVDECDGRNLFNDKEN